MKYGLTAREFAYLEEKLISPLKKLGATLYLFGSRARGTHHKFSDIDVLVESPADLSRTISAIAEEMESRNFPYKVDIVEDSSLADSYRASIYADRVKI